MQYYAISELELKQFHMAAIVAGGGSEAIPVLAGIRERKISYAEESRPTVRRKAPVQQRKGKTCPVCGCSTPRYIGGGLYKCRKDITCRWSGRLSPVA